MMKKKVSEFDLDAMILSVSSNTEANKRIIKGIKGLLGEQKVTSENLMELINFNISLVTKK